MPAPAAPRGLPSRCAAAIADRSPAIHRRRPTRLRRVRTAAGRGLSNGSRRVVRTPMFEAEAPTSRHDEQPSCSTVSTTRHRSPRMSTSAPPARDGSSCSVCTRPSRDSCNVRQALPGRITEQPAAFRPETRRAGRTHRPTARERPSVYAKRARAAFPNAGLRRQAWSGSSAPAFVASQLWRGRPGLRQSRPAPRLTIVRTD